jgi:sugar lactone lactonase YvrE
LVFNYNNSAVQVFDPVGNQTSEFIATESDGGDLNSDNMVVGRDGTIYIAGFNGILVFNENGELLREIINKDDLFIIHSITIGPDDTLYAISNTGIIRLDENGSADLKITEETIKEVSGESPGIGAMGVDAQGNIYFIGDFVKDVLKFSPNGEFISKFGGGFNSVRQITFDSYGRIYVVDFFEVKVYDSNYNYLDRIEGAFWGVDFDAQNYMYAVTTQGDTVVKYEIQKPGE